MDRYKAYLLPGVAALLLLAYYAWRSISGGSPIEPAAPKAATQPKAEPSRTAPEAATPETAPEPTAAAPRPGGDQ